jgi:hypothetical protein
MDRKTISFFTVLFLSTLGMAGCTNSTHLQQATSSIKSQFPTPTITLGPIATASMETLSTSIKFTPIRGEQVMVETAALEQSSQGEWSLKITGQLPTPCHKLQWEHQVENRDLNFTIISTQKPDSMCAQVIQDFKQTIPIPSLPAGVYNVYINGVLIGEISI